jgi:hypothetical protein
LVRYMSRSPVSLKRLRFAPGSKEVVYTRKGGHDTSEPAQDERIDAEEFVARVLVQIPEPRKHLVRYYGAPPERAALRRRWANLIRRVYEADPLVCPRCGAEMRVVSFITDPRVVKRIVDHLRKRDRPARPPPPHVHQPVASPA